MCPVGGKIVGVKQMDHDPIDFLRGISGCLLRQESGGSFFLALAPAQQPRDILRWRDLWPGLEVEVKFEDRWFQALIDEKDVDCVEVKYVGFSEDESFETIEKAQWSTRIRSPQPHLHLYGLTKLKLKSQDISARECHKFRNFGYVGSHLQAIAAIEEQLEAGEGLPRVAASLANPSMRRQLALPLANLRRYGPHLPGGGREQDAHQQAAIDRVQHDLEAIQVRLRNPKRLQP